MVRKDKKDTTCNRCGRTLATPQKLQNHLKRIFPCNPKIEENNTTNEEFERLGMITGDQEKEIIFREHELGPALRRRAVAKYGAVVPKNHPDNGSDIRRMLESQRIKFREILEKEYNKRGQFKFALCSLTKFLVGNDKKSRVDWLRNKQIIVFNYSEINNYISDAFEQIINQVEERGGGT